MAAVWDPTQRSWQITMWSSRSDHGRRSSWWTGRCHTMDVVALVRDDARDRRRVVGPRWRHRAVGDADLYGFRVDGPSGGRFDPVEAAARSGGAPTCGSRPIMIATAHVSSAPTRSAGHPFGVLPIAAAVPPVSDVAGALRSAARAGRPGDLRDPRARHATMRSPRCRSMRCAARSPGLPPTCTPHRRARGHGDRVAAGAPVRSGRGQLLGLHAAGVERPAQWLRRRSIAASRCRRS